MKNRLMEIYRELFKEDYVEKSMERCKNSRCLWLVVDISSVSSIVSADLGIRRQREKRPMITSKKVKSNYICTFLTTKSRHYGYDLEPVRVDLQKCNKLCDEFHFIKQSYKFIYIDLRRNTRRKVFKIPEYFVKDENLFKFCGVCGE
ncbi:hypothetical protein [Desulfurobacterium sp.]